MLELDPRIDRTKIKFVVNADDSLVGNIGYYTGLIKNFKDLSSSHSHGKIKEILSDAYCDDNIFIIENDDGYSVYAKYFIADEDLLPPAEEYRPFDSHEFLNKFDVGKIIRFRHKIRKEMDKVAYAPSVIALITSIEYYNDPTIRIGDCWYSLERLFEDYELWDEKLGWIPFGVKVHG